MDLFIWNKEMNLIRNGSTALGVAVGMLVFLLIIKKKKKIKQFKQLDMNNMYKLRGKLMPKLAVNIDKTL
jgi:uncharacterized membrane protein YgaE (UPF0421/DUF939 family)